MTINRKDKIKEKLAEYKYPALKNIAKRLGNKGFSKLKSKDLFLFILENNSVNALERELGIRKRRHFKVVTFVTATVALLVFYYNILPQIRDTLEEKGLIEMVCNRDVESGCSIDVEFKPVQTFSLRGLDNKSNDVFGDGGLTELKFIQNNKVYTFQVPYGSGHNHFFGLSYYGKEIFDSFSKLINIGIENSKLTFKGEILDLKDNKVIGWFNGNEFGTEGCGIHWNKDATAIEIIDHYGNVSFSAEYFYGDDKNGNVDGLLFVLGYFKHNDEFHIYNNKVTVTKDIKLAEKLIKEIKPIFEHRGKNSTGKRLSNKYRIKYKKGKFMHNI